jgi:hypothetical protein
VPQRPVVARQLRVIVCIVRLMCCLITEDATCPEIPESKSGPRKRAWVQVRRSVLTIRDVADWQRGIESMPHERQTTGRPSAAFAPATAARADRQHRRLIAAHNPFAVGVTPSWAES